MWQLHRILPSKVPRKEQFDAIRSLIDAKVIRLAGLSQVSIEQIEAAAKVFPVATVQNRYNLADRASEEVLDHCERQGIGFIPWFRSPRASSPGPARRSPRPRRAFFQTVPGESLPGTDAAYIPRMLERVLRGRRFAVRSCHPDVRAGVRRLCACRNRFSILAGGRRLRRGGILASIVLLRFLGSFQIAIVVVLLNLGMAAALMFPMSRKQLARRDRGGLLARSGPSPRTRLHRLLRRRRARSS